MAKKRVKRRTTRPRTVYTRSGDREEIRLGLRKVVRHRNKKTGQFVKKPKRRTRTVIRELYEYRSKVMGEFVTGRLVSLQKTETKKIGTINLNEWDGLIKDAMQASNIFTTVQNKAAKMVDIFITGFDGKTKIVIKKSLDLTDISKRYEIGDMMVGKIIDRLHVMGYRTEYDIKTIKYWNKLETKKREASAYKPLRNATLTFRVRW